MYQQLPTFKANQNIHEVLTDYSNRDDLADCEGQFIKHNSLKYGVHWIMRSVATYYMTEAFEAMKICSDDPDTRENALRIKER